jgi:GntR family transcriptional regulator / MocR family aminotransferase
MRRGAGGSLRRSERPTARCGRCAGRCGLRAALSGYLARVRGVRADPGRIVITQGFTQALSLICQVLAASGRGTVVVETPSHPGLWDTVRRAGLRLVGCPADAGGLNPATLADLGAEAVVAAPAHQFPTGAVLSAPRRHALIDWATARGGLIVEDDYDAEFRYDRAGIGAVQGLDPGRVAHVGTTAKTLAPGLRLGWVTAPAWLAGQLPDAKSAADSGSPVIAQLALANLITSGDYERQIVRARRTYRRRRDLLLHALSTYLPGLQPQGAAAGMQLLLPLPQAPTTLPSPRPPPGTASASPRCPPCTWPNPPTRGCCSASAAWPSTTSPAPSAPSPPCSPKPRPCPARPSNPKPAEQAAPPP